MTRQELLTKLRNAKATLRDEFGIEEIALFGSFARDEATEMSDVDIAILSAEKKDYFNRVNAKYFLEETLHRNVDLGYYDTIRPLLQRSIRRELIHV
jgi:predicted nucleotidyltransferase